LEKISAWKMVCFVYQQKKLESLDKEKKDMETLQAELGVLKREAEKAEQDAKDHDLQIWRGMLKCWFFT
jgi:mRNA-degrading endonuclease YafQ of YafQ-DinJ toxin-antitoxin module